MTRPSRRQFGLVAGTVLAGLAGCPGEPVDKDTPDLRVTNRRAEPATVAVRVRYDGETLVDDRFDLDPDEHATVEETTPASGTYHVAVDLDDGPSATHDWTVPEGEPRTDTHTLSIRLTAEGIEFGVVAA